MKRSVLSAVPLLLAVGGVIGCAPDETGEPDTLGEKTQEILKGTGVAFDTWGTANVGNVCSGTLLRDRWVLTAKSCNPGVGTSIAFRNGVTAAVTKVFAHPTLDVAIARIDRAITTDGFSFAFGPFPLYRGAVDQLLNKTLACQGWGHNSCPLGTNCTGFGALRSADLGVNFVGSSSYGLNINSNGQITASGDRGGGCLLTDTNFQKNKLTGVESQSNNVNSSGQVSAHAFRDWANGIIGSAPTLGALTGYERADRVSSIVYVNSSAHVIELGLGSGNWERNDLTSILGDVNASSQTAAMVRQDGYSSIIFRSGSHIRELSLKHGGGWNKDNLSTITGAGGAVGDPAAYVRSDRTAAVVYRDFNSRIREITLPAGGRWEGTDLTVAAGGTLVFAASDPVATVRADGVNSVVYRGTNNHIRELSLPLGGRWLAGDLTAITGAPNAIGKPFPYSRSDGVSSVLFRGADLHVYEISLSASGAWSYGDLTAAATAAAGTAAPSAFSDPVGYVRADGVSAVVFKGSDGRIYEMTMTASGGWGWAELTGFTGAPLATGDALSAFVRADRTSSVVYRTSDNKVHEIRLPKGGTWTYGNVTEQVGGAI